jgi:hypothetical protein
VPETFQSLAVIVLALLPGALYVWSFEREAGLWGINLPDRLLRFLGVSALFQILAAPLTVWAWHSYLKNGEWKSDGTLPWALYLIGFGYIAVPIALGLMLGRSAGGAGWLAALIHGERRPPRAWDHFFSRQPDGWVRLRLKSGTWLGGPYAEGAYAAGYPEPQDIYFDAAVVDSVTGAFDLDAAGKPKLITNVSVLVRWDEVEYLVFDDA